MKQNIRKYLRGESDASEQDNLLHWIREDEHLSEFQQIKEEWKTEVVKEAVPTEYVSNWQSIQSSMMTQLQNDIQRKQRALNFFRYAAIFIVLFAISAIVYLQKNERGNSFLTYTTVAADYGQISKISLPDSTVVWVNSGSSVKYNNQFSATNREIELVGEAFFKVHKNKNLPLVVANGDLRVKVLGTEFLVSAYPEESNIQVVLEKGKVELNSVTDKNLRQEIKPGEMASFDKSNKKLNIDNVNTNLYTSWKDGVINIYNMPLNDLVIRLEKRYNQKFKVEREIEGLHYTFTIKTEKLSNVLALMESITPIEAIQEGDVINLKRKK